MFRTTILAAAATPVPAVPAVAAPPTVKSVSLEQSTHGLVAIYFRTDAPAPRKANGGVRATAGLKSAQEASVGTFRAKTHCYVAYTKARGLKAGEKSKVHVALAGRETIKTLTPK